VCVALKTAMAKKFQNRREREEHTAICEQATPTSDGLRHGQPGTIFVFPPKQAETSFFSARLEGVAELPESRARRHSGAGARGHRPRAARGFLRVSPTAKRLWPQSGQKKDLLSCHWIKPRARPAPIVLSCPKIGTIDKGLNRELFMLSCPCFGTHTS